MGVLLGDMEWGVYRGDFWRGMECLREVVFFENIWF
jgi:hypothetical protein